MKILTTYPRAITLILLIVTILYCHVLWKKFQRYHSKPIIKKEMVTLKSGFIFDQNESSEEEANEIFTFFSRKLEDIVREKAYFIGD